jgi:hypothetical protein
MIAIWGDVAGSGAAILTGVLLAWPLILDMLCMNGMQLLRVGVHIQLWDLALCIWCHHFADPMGT